MPQFKFNQRVQYDTVYSAGEVAELSAADCENLRLGGYGDYVEETKAIEPPKVSIPDADRQVRSTDRQVRTRKGK